jgi:hypothetical protein
MEAFYIPGVWALQQEEVTELICHRRSASSRMFALHCIGTDLWQTTGGDKTAVEGETSCEGMHSRWIPPLDLVWI